MTEDWQVVELGDVCRLINGRAYKKAELLEAGKYPVLRVGNFFTNRNWYYSDLELDEDKYCENGDLLYAWSASFGPRIWEGGKVIYHYHIWKIELSQSKIDKRFLYYWFDWDKERIKTEQGAGTTMIHVTKGSMESRKVHLPPLPEQKRIVAILDEAFAGIDTAIANAVKNVANAKELFESYLTSIFGEPSSLWTKCKLGSLGRITSSKRIFKKEYQPEGVPFYRTKEIKELANGREISTELFISQDKYQEIAKKYGVPKQGDLLLTAIGTIGEIYVVKENDDRFYFKDGNVLWLKDFQGINSNFLKYALMSFIETLNRLSHGSAYNALPIEKLKEHEVPVPSERVQNEIVSDLDEMRLEAARLQSNYRLKLDALNELKQSLLQKAFSGELTAKQLEKETEDAL